MIKLVLNLITVKTPQQLDALSMHTYMLAAIVGIIFILLSALISNSIKYEGGSYPKDPGKRKLWFWALLIISFISFFLYNMFVVSSTVAPNLQSRFMTTNIISSSITLVVYFIIGFILSKMFSTGKLGNWFSSTKR